MLTYNQSVMTYRVVHIIPMRHSTVVEISLSKIVLNGRDRSENNGTHNLHTSKTHVRMKIMQKNYVGFSSAFRPLCTELMYRHDIFHNEY